MLSVVFAVTMLCGAPEPLPNDYVSAVMESGVLMDEVYGSHPYDLPTVASEDGLLSYRIIVDPLYQSYGRCFSHQVRIILTDERSWPDIREAGLGEIPQVWVILAPPGACGDVELPNLSCAAGAEGQGQARINYLRWISGSGYASPAEDRIHIINHEVGHLLGHGHEECGDVMAPFYDVAQSCELTPWPLAQEHDEPADKTLSVGGVSASAISSRVD